MTNSSKGQSHLESSNNSQFTTYRTFLGDVVLGHPEAYDATAQDVWSFKKVTDIIEGIEMRLSNMAGGFPFKAAGCDWGSSEVFYLAGEFSEGSEKHINIQKGLRTATSGYAAKRFIKAKYKDDVRPDFEEWRIQWMLYCVWAKCKGNADFRRKLRSLPKDKLLVEETTKDNGGTAEVWGCKNRELVDYRSNLTKGLEAKHTDLTKKNLEFVINLQTNAVRNIGTFTGQNNMGKILMICKYCVETGTEPAIDYDLLRSKHINILGQELQFPK